MHVTVDKAREQDHAYYFRLILNSDLPPEEQEVREFTYGKDQPLSKIRDEILAIVLNDHGDHQDDALPIEGDEYDIGP